MSVCIMPPPVNWTRLVRLILLQTPHQRLRSHVPIHYPRLPQPPPLHPSFSHTLHSLYLHLSPVPPSHPPPPTRPSHPPTSLTPSPPPGPTQQTNAISSVIFLVAATANILLNSAPIFPLAWRGGGASNGCSGPRRLPVHYTDFFREMFARAPGENLAMGLSAPLIC